MYTFRQVLKGHVFFFLCKIKPLCCLQSNKERLNFELLDYTFHEWIIQWTIRISGQLILIESVNNGNACRSIHVWLQLFSSLNFYLIFSFQICEELLTRCLAPDCQMGGLGCDNMTVIIVCFLHGGTYEELCERCSRPSDSSSYNGNSQPLYSWHRMLVWNN